MVDVHDDLLWCANLPPSSPPGRGDLGTPQYTVLIWQNAAKKPQNWSFFHDDCIYEKTVDRPSVPFLFLNKIRYPTSTDV